MFRLCLHGLVVPFAGLLLAFYACVYDSRPLGFSLCTTLDGHVPTLIYISYVYGSSFALDIWIIQKGTLANCFGLVVVKAPSPSGKNWTLVRVPFNVVTCRH